MRRAVARQSIQKVIEDIRDSEIAEMLERGIETLRGGGKQSGEWVSLEPFQKLTIRFSTYSEEERELLLITGLNKLIDPDFWTKLLSGNSPDLFIKVRSDLRFALEHLPKIEAIFEQDHHGQFISNFTQFDEPSSGMTIVLAEDKGQFSSAKRIILALQSVNNLYDGFGELEGAPVRDLLVLGCDSGSDKSFDLLGAASIMAQLKETIIAIWDRKVYYRHMQFKASVDAISNSLPVIEKIHHLAESGAIEKESAEIIKRKILKGCEGFLEAGVTTPEMDGAGIVSPRALMRPEPKLISGPDQPLKSTQKAPTDSALRDAADQQEVGSLSRLELQRLREILKNDNSNNGAIGKDDDIVGNGTSDDDESSSEVT